MATLGDIKAAVKVHCQDSSKTGSTKLNLLVNEGLRHVAKKLLLPDLESSGVVSTTLNQNFTVYPASWNFMRNLYQCEVADTEKITIFNSVEHLERVVPNYETEAEEGDIKYVVPNFASIIYYPIPAVVTDINCRFYKLPATLVKDTDPITGIPEGYQEVLLENYVLSKVWKSIEDSMEGPPKNAMYYKGLFDEAFNELDDKIDTGQSRAEVARINHFSI